MLDKGKCSCAEQEQVNIPSMCTHLLCTSYPPLPVINIQMIQIAMFGILPWDQLMDQFSKIRLYSETIASIISVLNANSDFSHLQMQGLVFEIGLQNALCNQMLLSHAVFIGSHGDKQV